MLNVLVVRTTVLDTENVLRKKEKNYVFREKMIEKFTGGRRGGGGAPLAREGGGGAILSFGPTFDVKGKR